MDDEQYRTKKVFTLIFNKLLLTITPFYNEDKEMFKVEFPAEIILYIYKENNQWKTEGESDHHLTDEIGHLIDDHISG